ncbi:MAG: prepilin peptidase [Alphaproteobacteria bacterium]|nr:prepilin peptidase [Alphaproteobacteria bacterium]USO07446.1 MAG: prepilin peptidase [Rhodospirillales bacterium]
MLPQGLIDLFHHAPAFRAGVFFCLGLCLGSFATALVYRLPRGLNWTTERSRCPSCGHALGVPDLVPVFSWLFLRGRCRHCGTRIPARYPLIELGFGVFVALIGWMI